MNFAMATSLLAWSSSRILSPAFASRSEVRCRGLLKEKAAAAPCLS